MLCLGITGLYWIITGIQYWISDYLINNIINDERIVFITFGIISVTGPVGGVIVGGNITTRLGGYTSYKSLYACLMFGFVACLSAWPIPFTKDFYVICTCLWLLLFCGGSLLPCMTGIMLTSVD